MRRLLLRHCNNTSRPHFKPAQQFCRHQFLRQQVKVLGTPAILTNQTHYQWTSPTQVIVPGANSPKQADQTLGCSTFGILQKTIATKGKRKVNETTLGGEL